MFSSKLYTSIGESRTGDGETRKICLVTLDAVENEEFNRIKNVSSYYMQVCTIHAGARELNELREGKFLWKNFVLLFSSSSDILLLGTR